jgi:hypothetical protein
MTAWLFLELAIFLDDLGELLFLGLCNGNRRLPLRTTSTSFRHQEVLMKWIEQCEECLDDPNYRPTYRRLEMENSMLPPQALESRYQMAR